MGTLSTRESTHLRQHVQARALGDVRADLGKERAEILNGFLGVLGGTLGVLWGTRGYLEYLQRERLGKYRAL